MRRTVIYDADCGICTASARWLARRDRRGRLDLVAAQDERGVALLSRAHMRRAASETIVVLRGWDSGPLVRSSAVVCALWTAGGWARGLGGLLWLVPKPIREWGYRWVARNRHRFGGGEACAVGGV